MHIKEMESTELPSVALSDDTIAAHMVHEVVLCMVITTLGLIGVAAMAARRYSR